MEKLTLKERVAEIRSYFSTDEELKDVKVIVEDKENKVDKFEDVTLLDGTVVIVEPALEVGASILAKDPNDPDVTVPMPIGEYELEDGSVIVVEVDGVIAEVKALSEEAPEEAPVDEEMGEGKTAEAQRQAKKVIESIVKEHVFALTEKVEELEKSNKFLKEENEVLTANFSELKSVTGEAVLEFLKTPTKEPVKKNKSVFKKEEHSNYFTRQKK